MDMKWDTLLVAAWVELVTWAWAPVVSYLPLIMSRDPYTLHSSIVYLGAHGVMLLVSPLRLTRK